MSERDTLILAERIDKLSSAVEKTQALLVIFAGRHTDPTHFSIREAAKFLRISPATVRKRFANRFEVIPVSGRRGLPLDVVLAAWVPETPTRERRIA